MNIYGTVGPSPSSSAQYYCPNEPQQFQFNGGTFPQSMSTIICIENQQQFTIDQQQTFFYYSPDQQFQQQEESVECINFPHQQPTTIVFGPSIDPPSSFSIVPNFRHELEQQNYAQPSSSLHIPLNSNQTAINMKKTRKQPVIMPSNSTQKQNLLNFIICPECSQRFRQQEAFNSHFESCWVEAVEKEHRQLLLENTFKLSSNENQRKKGEIEKIVNLSIEQEADYITLENGRRKQKIMWGNFNKVANNVEDEEAMIDIEEEDDGNPPKLFPALQDEMPIFNEEVIIDRPIPFSDSIKNPTNYEHQITMNSPPKSISRIECPLCGFRLYRHNLGPHLRIHSGELPFPCTFCPKKFRTTSAMKVHHRTHTGERPYKCPFCGYACTTKRNLDRHIGNRHHQYY